MRIKLYNTSSDVNVLDKVLENEEIIDNADTNRDYNILNPIVRLVTENVFNYCYIPDLGKYYYISNPIYLRHGIVELHLSIDVLMSYKDKIKEIVATNIDSENYNKYDSSNTFATESRQTIEKKEFESPFNSDGNLVLICVNEGN